MQLFYHIVFNHQVRTSLARRDYMSQKFETEWDLGTVETGTGSYVFQTFQPATDRKLNRLTGHLLLSYFKI